MVRFLVVAAIAGAVALGGCYSGEQPRCSIACSTDDECPSGLACSQEGRCGEVGASCEIQCEPRTYLRCDGSKAKVCNAAGNGAEEYPCAAGGCISDDTGPHCVHVVPEYAESVCDQPSTLADFVPPVGSPISVDNTAMCSTVIEQGDVDLCVIHAGTITVPRETALVVSGKRALALVADRELVIYETAYIDMYGHGGQSAAGSDPQESGGGPNSGVGGDGAGNSTVGGLGGGQQLGTGGPLIEPLPRSPSFVGGRAATSSSPLAGQAVLGGGGGGALMLVSCLGKVQVSGLIDAGGGGGGGGRKIVVTPTSGAGGGAGGHLLIQALEVDLEIAKLYANGGGGGGGIGADAATSPPGVRGDDGSRSTTLGANGGAAGEGGSNRGGRGGFMTTAGARGIPEGPVGTTGVYSGGGGSPGIIELAVPGGDGSQVLQSTTMSPAPKFRILTTR